MQSTTRLKVIFHVRCKRLQGSLTMIIIAHRLSSVSKSDRVIVMSGGKVLEQGKPEQLRLGDGAFARLHELEPDNPSQSFTSVVADLPLTSKHPVP